LPHEDADAAAVLEDVFAERGTTLVKHARAERVVRIGDEVVVRLADGRSIEASHALMTVGSVPNTADIGLERVGIETGPGGFISVDRVSRTSVSGIYAAGDCTGLLMLASVAQMQGRIAMWHALARVSRRSSSRPWRPTCSPIRRSPRRHQPAGHRLRRRAGPHGHAARWPPTPAPRWKGCTGLCEGVLPTGDRRW